MNPTRNFRRARRALLGFVTLAALGWAPRAGAREPIVTRFDVPDNRIAITFDACATKTHGYGFDRHVYRVLQREQVPATIFVSGRWAEFHPAVMTELSADPLIEFGNHSYDHPHMSRLTNDDMEREVDETEAVLGRYGKHGVAFRPPFGDFNARMLDVVRERGLPVVSWDVVSGDPAAATTTQGMIREVERHTRPGSIVIFHINGRGWKTAEALPSILRELRSRGFSFVHLSELLGAPPAPPVLAAAASPRPPAVEASPAVPPRPPAAASPPVAAVAAGSTPLEAAAASPPVAPPAAVMGPKTAAPPPAASRAITGPFVLAPEIAPQIVPEPATVQPPPFRAPAVVSRAPASAPSRDGGGRPVIIEATGHAPTAASMRWASEGAKRVPATNREPVQAARPVAR